MAQKYRAQILLEPEQHEALQRIAEQEGRSISDVARQIIWIGLEVVQKDSQALWRQRMFALEELKQIRERVQQQYGIYQGDLLAEARAERERQNEQVWKGEAEE